MAHQSNILNEFQLLQKNITIEKPIFRSLNRPKLGASSPFISSYYSQQIQQEKNNIKSNTSQIQKKTLKNKQDRDYEQEDSISSENYKKKKTCISQQATQKRQLSPNVIQFKNEIQQNQFANQKYTQQQQQQSQQDINYYEYMNLMMNQQQQDNQKLQFAKTSTTIDQRATCCKCKKNNCKSQYCACVKQGFNCLSELCHCNYDTCQNKQGSQLVLKKKKKEYCQCTQRNCLSKYCDCKKGNKKCSDLCKCKDCQNLEIEPWVN